jgi:hypothetical protein
MRKFCLVLSAVMLLLTLCGCNILETDNPPTLPQIDLDSSTLTGTVEFVNGRTCRVVVTEGDSHFDGPYENKRGELVSGDLIQVTYSSLSGEKSVSVGDTITFTYRYTQNVSEKNGDPHITVNEIHVTK